VIWRTDDVFLCRSTQEVVSHDDALVATGWWGEEKPDRDAAFKLLLVDMRSSIGISKQSVLDSDTARQQINGENTELVGSSWAWKMEFAYPNQKDGLN
jgi:hypothetical protein